MSIVVGKVPVTVFDIRDLPSMDPMRPGKTDTMVTYDVDPLHRYFITAPREQITDTKGEYDQAKLAVFIRKDLDARTKVLGKSIEV
jgi:hypothetical protein